MQRLDPGKFAAVQRWDAHKKMGQAVAYEVSETLDALVTSLKFHVQESGHGYKHGAH